MRDPRQQDLVEMLTRSAAGDRAAFRALYERTVAKLYASIRRILRNEAAAEDAVQEAYVRIWRNASGYDANIASPIAWMTTIARHAAIDMARRGAERISAASGEIDPEIADLSPETPQPSGRLKSCLEQLDVDRRGMVLLAYCQGWSREELSRRYDRPVATVKTLLRRSLIALKECLGGGD